MKIITFRANDQDLEKIQRIKEINIEHNRQFKDAITDTWVIKRCIDYMYEKLTK